MNVFDRSNYFRGSLLLIKKNHKISKPESDLTKRIGKALGFEKGFCANAIQEALDNKYLLETPPVFSSKELAMKFIKDGLILAAADNDIHPLEEKWLVSVVKRNDLDILRFLHEKAKLIEKGYLPQQLEVEKMVIQH